MPVTLQETKVSFNELLSSVDESSKVVALQKDVEDIQKIKDHAEQVLTYKSALEQDTKRLLALHRAKQTAAQGDQNT